MTNNIDDRFASIRQLQRRLERLEASETGYGLKEGDGGGTSDGMDSRVTRLEVQMEHMREDVSEIKADLKAVLGHLSNMPTRKDLREWERHWLVTGVALFAIIVGSIIGGLGWLGTLLK